MDWYWIVLISIGGFLVLFNLICWFIASKVLKAATTPTAYSLEHAREYQAEHEKMDFVDYDTVWRKEDFEVDGRLGKVCGEVVYNDTPSPVTKVVVICHGHTWNRINSVKYARIFYAKGYNVVLYDHPYFGKSDGKFTTVGALEKYDLNNVLDFVRQKFGKDAFVGLHGESMGAATVLMELGLRTDIDFVVADCPFSDTMRYYRELYKGMSHLPSFPVVDMSNSMAKRKFDYDFKKASPIEAVKGSQTPICFIHGKEDKFIFPSHSEAMFKCCQNPLSQLHLFDGAEHARSHVTNPELYKKVVTEFLDVVEANLVKAAA